MHQLADLGTVIGHQYLLSGCEELLDAGPGVGDEAGTRPSRLEYPRRRRIAESRHACAADIEHAQRSGVECIVFAGIDMPEHAHVRQVGACLPAVAAEQKAALRTSGSRAKEKFLHPRLAIRQPVAHESEVGREMRVRRHRVVGRTIQPVVDGHATTRAQPGISRHHRGTAAVGENQIVLGNERTKGIVGIVLDPLQGRRRVDVPEHDRVPRPLEFEHFALQQRIENPHATRLDDDIGIARPRQGIPQRRFVGRINDDPSPLWRFDITMLLAFKNIRLMKCNLMATLGERANQAPVIGGSAVPPRRQQARTEERNLHKAGMTKDYVKSIAK